MPSRHSPGASEAAIAFEELQHRTRNMLALIRSVVRRSSSIGGCHADFPARLADRLDAILRVQAMLIRDPAAPVALRDLVDQEVQTPALLAAVEATIDGPPVDIKPAGAPLIGLAVHELVANSVQHGAVGLGAGKLAIVWELRNGGLLFRWRERSDSRRQRCRDGFGVDLLVNALPYELKASSSLEIHRGRVDLTVEFPPETIAEAALLSVVPPNACQ